MAYCLYKPIDELLLRPCIVYWIALYDIHCRSDDLYKLGRVPIPTFYFIFISLLSSSVRSYDTKYYYNNIVCIAFFFVSVSMDYNVDCVLYVGSYYSLIL